MPKTFWPMQVYSSCLASPTWIHTLLYQTYSQASQACYIWYKTAMSYSMQEFMWHEHQRNHSLATRGSRFRSNVSGCKCTEVNLMEPKRLYHIWIWPYEPMRNRCRKGIQWARPTFNLLKFSLPLWSDWYSLWSAPPTPPPSSWRASNPESAGPSGEACTPVPGMEGKEGHVKLRSFWWMALAT